MGGVFCYGYLKVKEFRGILVRIRVRSACENEKGKEEMKIIFFEGGGEREATTLL